MRYLAPLVLLLCLTGSAFAQRPHYRPVHPAYRPVYPAVVYPANAIRYPYMPPVQYPVHPVYTQPSYGYQYSWWYQW